MTLHRNPSVSHICEPGSDDIWTNLYSFLHPFVKRLVFSSGISSWRGQEEDVVEDIVQETIVRVLKCMRRVECGEGAPIVSPKALSIVIARNYYKDLRRRDKRLLRIAGDYGSPGIHVVLYSQFDPSELALNNIFLEWLYVKFSMEVVKFSRKQRTALLIDLTNRMNFSLEPTPLQKAFLEVGIPLQEYQHLLPAEPVARSRHASLVSLGYKRIARLIRAQ